MTVFPGLCHRPQYSSNRQSMTARLLQVPPPYKPKEDEGKKVKPAQLEKGKDKRDSRGRLVFKDFPAFKPTLRPKDVIQAGSFGG